MVLDVDLQVIGFRKVGRRAVRMQTNTREQSRKHTWKSETEAPLNKCLAGHAREKQTSSASISGSL